MKPMRSTSPTTTAETATAQTEDETGFPGASEQHPCAIALKATANRRRMRPTPGQPSGKLEKSFCSLCLLGGKNALPLRLALLLGNWTPRAGVFFSPLTNRHPGVIAEVRAV